MSSSLETWFLNILGARSKDMREQLHKSRLSRIIYRLPKNIMLITIASGALLVMASGIGIMFTGSRFFDEVKGLFSVSQTAPE
ncbi:MAG: hypothetical protein F6K47_18720, partial [Symploca sp. SIO2E6]|nr:hypothetical protein [Symploca sp. SIO2E6]